MPLLTKGYYYQIVLIVKLIEVAVSYLNLLIIYNYKKAMD